MYRYEFTLLIVDGNTIQTCTESSELEDLNDFLEFLSAWEPIVDGRVKILSMRDLLMIAGAL